jgi:hypothetical protein
MALSGSFMGNHGASLALFVIGFLMYVTFGRWVFGYFGR